MITIFVILDSFGSKLFPGKSCKDISAKYTSPASGTYWIKLASNKTFEVYCDMETRGGGWIYTHIYNNVDFSVQQILNDSAQHKQVWSWNICVL